MHAEKNIISDCITVLIKYAFNFSAGQRQILGVPEKYAPDSAAVLAAEVTF